MSASESDRSPLSPSNTTRSVKRRKKDILQIRLQNHVDSPSNSVSDDQGTGEASEDEDGFVRAPTHAKLQWTLVSTTVHAVLFAN